MTDGTLDATTTVPGSDGPTDDAGSLPQTAEERDAYWQKRQSGIDRSHNAEVAALKEQVALLQARASSAPPPPDETPDQRRVRELEAQLEGERARSAAASMAAKYPLLSEVLDEAFANIVSMPGEKLAALEARIEQTDGGQPARPLIDPNAAPRQRSSVQGPQAKPLDQMSKEDLLVELKRNEPAFKQSLQEG